MRLRNSENHWGLIAVSIHWFSAIAIFGLFALGLWMVELEYYHPWYREAQNLHKSIGILLFGLTMVRLVWRRSNCSPVVLASYKSIERKIATVVHYSLYVFLISVMFSGYLISTADGRAVVVFNGLQIPAVYYGIAKLEDIAGIVHLWLAISLISLAVLHAMAAIKHHLFDHDPTLKRMFGL